MAIFFEIIASIFHNRFALMINFEHYSFIISFMIEVSVKSFPNFLYKITIFWQNINNIYHSVARANLYKSEWLLTNTTAAYLKALELASIEISPFRPKFP